MKVINENGEYVQNDQGDGYEKSSHPAHNARIDIALGKGTWLFAPKRGHELGKYAKLDKTSSVEESFKKELLLYLEKYSPEVSETFVTRGAVDMGLTIKKDALDV